MTSNKEPISSDYTVQNDQWINDFLTEKSHISPADKTIQSIAQTILASDTLKELVQARFLDGNRFLGWTEDGSKGFTDISTGDIWIGKTEKGTEPFTLGYECINSKNRKIYRNIGIKYAFEEPTIENREKFANEILAIEAQAMYVKCKLAIETGKKEMVKSHFLEIFENELLEEPEKIEQLKNKIVEKGLVHNTIPAYEFYKGERYDEIVGYYRKKIASGEIQ